MKNANSNNQLSPPENWWLKDIPQSKPFWTDVNILRFLRLYRSHPELWDSRRIHYNDRCVRRITYREIARKLKLKYVDEEECATLVEQLKKRYVEEKEFCRNEIRPPWFSIISDIISRILNSKQTPGNKLLLHRSEHSVYPTFISA